MKHRNTKHCPIAKLGSETFGCSISVSKYMEVEAEIMRPSWKKRKNVKYAAILKDFESAIPCNMCVKLCKHYDSKQKHTKEVHCSDKES